MKIDMGGGRLYIVYDPSAWNPEKVAGATGIHLDTSFEEADRWRKANGHADCPIYSYRQGRKSLEDERLEDNVPNKYKGKELPTKAVAVKPLDFLLIITAWIAVGLAWLLGWDKEAE